MMLEKQGASCAMAPKQKAERLRQQLLQKASVLDKMTKGRKKSNRLPKTLSSEQMLQGMAKQIL